MSENKSDAEKTKAAIRDAAEESYRQAKLQRQGLRELERQLNIKKLRKG